MKVFLPPSGTPFICTHRDGSHPLFRAPFLFLLGVFLLFLLFSEALLEVEHPDNLIARRWNLSAPLIPSHLAGASPAHRPRKFFIAFLRGAGAHAQCLSRRNCALPALCHQIQMRHSTPGMETPSSGPWNCLRGRNSIGSS